MSQNSQATSAELIKRSEELRQQAEALKKKEAPEVLARIKDAIAHYGFSAADLGFGTRRGAAKADPEAGPEAARKRPGRKARRASAIRYRDAAGNSWSGFGPKPRWFKEALAAGATPDSLKA